MKIPSLNLNIPIENYTLEYKFNLENTKNYLVNIIDNLNPLSIESECLFKFYTISDHSFDALENNYFYLTSPDKFNDPFDCLVHQEEEMQKKYPMRKEIYENLGATCFSNNLKNPSMWNRYTNDYSGFCIKFKKIKLVDRSLIEIGTNVFYTKKHLNPLWFYQNVFKEIDAQPIQNSSKSDMKFILTVVHKYCQKSYEWQNEEEYRFVSLRCLENSRKLNFNPQCVEEIYIGYKMSDTDKHRIINLMKKQYPDCKINLARPSSHSRELVFTPQ